MSEESILAALSDFPTSFHFVAAARKRLVEGGFTELFEKDTWEAIPNKFFVVSGEQHIMAFNVTDYTHGLFFQTNTASMHLEVEKNFFIAAGCEQCTVKHHGTGCWWSWIDRDLTLAGVAYVKGQGSKLVNLRKPVCMIPSIAVHLRPGSGLKGKFTPKNEFKPIFSLKQDGEECDTVLKLLAEHLECSKEDIEDYNLILIPADEPNIIGAGRDMVCGYGIAARIGSVYGLNAFLNADAPESGLNCFASLHSESRVTSEAVSFFLRILTRLGCTQSFYEKSLLVSVENLPRSGRSAASLKMSNNAYFQDGVQQSYALTDMKELFVKHMGALCEPALMNSCIEGVAGNVTARTNMQAIRVGISLSGLDTVRERTTVDSIKAMESVAERVFTLFKANTEESQ